MKNNIQIGGGRNYSWDREEEIVGPSQLAPIYINHEKVTNAASVRALIIQISNVARE